MEEGLTSCKFFFFFVSVNSLQSNMVKMEWQNAIFKAALIPLSLFQYEWIVVICHFFSPQNLYIDLFSNGLDVAIRQIVDVINGTNTYHIPASTFHNLVAVKQRVGNKILLSALQNIVRANFRICLLHSVKSRFDSSEKRVSDACKVPSVQKAAKFENGYVTNIFYSGAYHAVHYQIFLL